ncbi:hypothetical protein ANCDUO_13550 [Ancylostoma duodenale]|uniref:Bestrophin homolog n=1 Tax=Ancylostoma duodenale TaxID=51022 RepID=A0A0C2G5J9_9BILA|nr:hypothetical protein ANCDUO_13550 [Ancylostoma duodenale]
MYRRAILGVYIWQDDGELFKEPASDQYSQNHWMCMWKVLVFRDVSLRVRRRFPTLDTVLAAGFMMPHEKEIFESYSDKANILRNTGYQPIGRLR